MSKRLLVEKYLDLMNMPYVCSVKEENGLNVMSIHSATAKVIIKENVSGEYDLKCFKNKSGRWIERENHQLKNFSDCIYWFTYFHARIIYKTSINKLHKELKSETAK